MNKTELEKFSDDICISIARSFERLEERLDAVESRIYIRLAEIEDKIYQVELLIKDDQK